jgi:site-specific DNA-adenine methylase
VEISREELLRRRTVHSPLRYPGGKRRLVPYVAALLQANALQPDVLVEPFAGGASVALELVVGGLVAQIAIADSDPYVAAFWQTAFFDCDWLCTHKQAKAIGRRARKRVFLIRSHSTSVTSACSTCS